MRNGTKKEEEIKLLDKAWKLQRAGKTAELEKLIGSANFSKETEYLFKPELRVIDERIKSVEIDLKRVGEEIAEADEEPTDVLTTQQKSLTTYRDTLANLRELTADSDVATAMECLQLSHPEQMASLIAISIDLVKVKKPTDLSVAIRDRRTQLSNEVNALNSQIKNNDPTDEIKDLLQAARALNQDPVNTGVLLQLFEGKRADGKTPLLSLKSQQAIRPNLKAIDDRLQELAERSNVEKGSPEMGTLMEVRKQTIRQGYPDPMTVRKLSVESQAAILKPKSSIEKLISEKQIEVEMIKHRMDSSVNIRDVEAEQRYGELTVELEALYKTRDDTKVVLDKGKNLFLDSISPYIKQRLRMKRITEWVQVASDVLAIASTVASIAGFALLVSTGWGAIPALAVVVLLLASSTIVRYGVPALYRLRSQRTATPTPIPRSCASR